MGGAASINLDKEGARLVFPAEVESRLFEACNLQAIFQLNPDGILLRRLVEHLEAKFDILICDDGVHRGPSFEKLERISDMLRSEGFKVIWDSHLTDSVKIDNARLVIIALTEDRKSTRLNSSHRT